MAHSPQLRGIPKANHWHNEDVLDAAVRQMSQVSAKNDTETRDANFKTKVDDFFNSMPNADIADSYLWERLLSKVWSNEDPKIANTVAVAAAGLKLFADERNRKNTFIKRNHGGIIPQPAEDNTDYSMSNEAQRNRKHLKVGMFVNAPWLAPARGWGNFADGHFLSTPSGAGYEKIYPFFLVEVNDQGPLGRVGMLPFEGRDGRGLGNVPAGEEHMYLPVVHEGSSIAKPDGAEVLLRARNFKVDEHPNCVLNTSEVVWVDFNHHFEIIFGAELTPESVVLLTDKMLQNEQWRKRTTRLLRDAHITSALADDYRAIAQRITPGKVCKILNGNVRVVDKLDNYGYHPVGSYRTYDEKVRDGAQTLSGHPFVGSENMKTTAQLDADLDDYRYHGESKENLDALAQPNIHEAQDPIGSRIQHKNLLAHTSVATPSGLDSRESIAKDYKHHYSAPQLHQSRDKESITPKPAKDDLFGHSDTARQRVDRGRNFRPQYRNAAKNGSDTTKVTRDALRDRGINGSDITAASRKRGAEVMSPSEENKPAKKGAGFGAWTGAWGTGGDANSVTGPLSPRRATASVWDDLVAHNFADEDTDGDLADTHTGESAD